MENKYFTLIKEACERVRRTKGINVSLFNIEFYGIHKYSQENIYKVDLITDNGLFTIYQDERSFKSWANVPWSGLNAFKPADFEDWPEDKKLILAWCWAIYNYCKNLSDYQNTTPPPIED